MGICAVPVQSWRLSKGGEVTVRVHPPTLDYRTPDAKAERGWSWRVVIVNAFSLALHFGMVVALILWVLMTA